MKRVASRWARSYRSRLAIGYLLVVALFATAWAWSLFGPLTNAVIQQQFEHLKAVSQAGRLALESSGSPLEVVVDQLVEDTTLRVTVVDTAGTVLADNEAAPPLMDNHRDRPEIRAALSGLEGRDRRMSETQGMERIYIAIPATYQGRRVAVRVSASLEEVNSLAARARQTGLFLLIGALAIAGLIVTRLTAQASEPIERLTTAAQAMAAGNLNATVGDEAGDLRVLSEALRELQSQMRLRLEDVGAEKRNMRAVLDGLDDAVFLLHDERIRFANSAASRLFRTPVAGWRDLDIAEAGLPRSIVSVVHAHLDTEEVIEDEWGPDPSGRHLRLTIRPLNPTEEYRRTLVSVSDITERVRLDRVRRDFVANASHELKTPVAGIQLLADSAATAAEDGHTDQAVDFARQISSEAARLGYLVRDLLDLSRLENRPVPGSITDLREAIENALIGHRVAAQDRLLELGYDDSGARGRDAYVSADATDVAVALDNLLDNAIKYTEKGLVTVSLAVTSEHAEVTVTDTGIGIPARDLSRIFERFYRVDRARSRESGGTGLGLALVKHVVERSGGSVDVRSTEGRGSSFILRFRLASRS